MAADALTWGLIDKCPECKNKKVTYNCYEYVCHGWISEFARCGWKGDKLKRFLFLRKWFLFRRRSLFKI